MQANAAADIFSLSLSCRFTGREPDFGQRSVQFLKNVSFPIQPGHLQVRAAADASQLRLLHPPKTPSTMFPHAKISSLHFVQKLHFASFSWSTFHEDLFKKAESKKNNPSCCHSLHQCNMEIILKIKNVYS